MSGIGNSQIGRLEQGLVDLVLRRRTLFRFAGESVNSFCHYLERQVTRDFEVAGALLLPSASAGLDLILETFDLPGKAKVGTLPLSWAAVYSALIRRGHELEFLRFRGLFEIDLEYLEQRLKTGCLRLLVIPHLFGRAVRNIEAVERLSAAYGVPLVEDIAQSFGVKIGDRYVGSFGEAAYTSFNRHKVLSAGDGGMVLFRDPERLTRAWRVHDQGCMPNGNTRRADASTFLPGTSLRINEMTGAVLAAQYARLYQIRSKIWRIYREVESGLAKRGFQVLEPLPGDLPFVALFDGSRLIDHPSLWDSGWHVFSHVPYPEVVRRSLDETDRSLLERLLRNVSSVGCGFIDKYLATPVGVELSVPEPDLTSVVGTVLGELS